MPFFDAGGPGLCLNDDDADHSDELCVIQHIDYAALEDDADFLTHPPNSGNTNRIIILSSEGEGFPWLPLAYPYDLDHQPQDSPIKERLNSSSNRKQKNFIRLISFIKIPSL